MAASISTFRPKPPGEQATQTLRDLALELEGFSALGFGPGTPPASELEPEGEARGPEAPLAPPVVGMPPASVPVLAADAGGAARVASEAARGGEDNDSNGTSPRASRRSRLLAWLLPWRKH